jgi:Bacterial protein of unknown function (DUF839)
MLLKLFLCGLLASGLVLDFAESTDVHESFAFKASQENDESNAAASTGFERALQAASFSGRVTALELYDADTDKKIGDIENGKVFVIGQNPSLNIKAVVTRGFGSSWVRSVNFAYNSTKVRNDIWPPFTFCRALLSNYRKCSQLGYGSHTVSATPYGGLLSNRAGPPFTVTFRVSSVAVPPVAPPQNATPSAPAKAPSAPASPTAGAPVAAPMAPSAPSSPAAAPIAPNTPVAPRAPMAPASPMAAPVAPAGAPMGAPVAPAAPMTSPVAPATAPANAPTAPATAPKASGATTAPVKPPTQAPVKPPTQAPVKPPTQAPVKPPTKSPVNAPTKSPSGLTYFPGKATVRENGLILSEGLTSRLIAEAGKKVQYANGQQSTDVFHSLPDGAAVFRDPLSTSYKYVSNSEVSNSGGGVGAITFDQFGNVTGYERLQTGSSRNCGGGKTFWNTWLTCEEFASGQVWEIDPFAKTARKTLMAQPYPSFWEAAAYDNRNPSKPTFYATIDRDNGPLLRYSPPTGAVTTAIGSGNYSQLLHTTGDNITWEYLVLTPLNGSTGTFSWTTTVATAEACANSYYKSCEGIGSSIA